MHKTKMMLSVLMNLLSWSVFAIEYQDVCAVDAQNYCPGVSRQNGELIHCLYQKQSVLQKECRDKVIKIQSNTHARREECKADAEKFCVGIEHGGGRINACLKQHLSELTETCRKNVLSTMPRDDQSH